MRQLLPDPCDPVDLDAAYAVSDGGAPHVRVNFVTSADGAAELRGRSDPLSGTADKQVFALLRDHAEVVLVGAGTARVEGYGPVETTPDRQGWRRERGLQPVPPIAVVTGSLDLDLAAPLFQHDPRPLVLTSARAPADRRTAFGKVADVVVAGEHSVDLAVALDALAERGLRRVLCEGGPQLFGHLLAADRLDELCLTVSPLLAGPGHTGIVRGLPLPRPMPLRVGHLLEDDGALFVRYVRSL